MGRLLAREIIRTPRDPHRPPFCLRNVWIMAIALSAWSAILPGVVLCGSADHQETLRWTPHPDLSFRSIQIDASTLPFILAVSGSIDVDFLALAREKRSALGIRVGAEHTVTGGAGGGGEDLYDINFLIRVTSAGSRGRIDVAAGVASRAIGGFLLGANSDPAVKFVFEGRLNLIARWLGLFFKASAAKAAEAQTKFFLGVGAFVSWDVTP
jgi:hypothetical protein